MINKADLLRGGAARFAAGGAALALWLLSHGWMILRRRAQAAPLPTVPPPAVAPQAATQTSAAPAQDPIASDAGEQPQERRMSDVNDLIKGKLKPGQFIAKEAANLKALMSNPFMAALVPIALEALQLYLTAALKSPTIAGLIVSDIQQVMDGNPGALTGQAETALVTFIEGAMSGQSGSKTGQQVLSAVTNTPPSNTVPGGGSATTS